MIGVNVTFNYEGDFGSRSHSGHRPECSWNVRGNAGLSLQVLYFRREAATATNFYVWDSRDAAERFFSAELRERVTGLYGVAPTIEFVEIAQIVDNSAS